MHNSHYLWAWMLSRVFYYRSQVKRRRSPHENSFIFYHVVCHVQSLLVLYFIGFVYDCRIEVVCGSVQANTLYNCIEGILESVSLFLLIGVENTILNLIKQPTALGVRQNNINLWIFMFKRLRHPSYRSTCPSSTHKRSQVAISLWVYLRTRFFVVDIMIIEVFELVHEEGAGFGWVGIG